MRNFDNKTRKFGEEFEKSSQVTERSTAFGVDLHKGRGHLEWRFMSSLFDKDMSHEGNS